jgi:benzylsuccinate CoA-transferase BbsF subunit
MNGQLRPGPVAGLKVLDFTHVFAGPFCTRNLADLGADIVHVESRSRDPGDRHRSSFAHRNKRSISLDLKNEDGHAIATRLAGTADVIVENFSSNVMRRLKLDYDTLCAENPGLIYVSLSGYGHTGPRNAWTSMNLNLQAFTGLMMTTGSEGDPPTSISNSWNDYLGGLHGVIAILHALAERAQSGRGRNIDLSQFECSVATLGPLLMASAVSGTAPKRWGNRSSKHAPQGVYPCSGNDEWCALTVETDEQWRALARAIGAPELANDPGLADPAGRMRRHDELDAVIGAWTSRHSKVDAERVLQAAGVPAERMRRIPEVVNSSDSGRVYHPVPDERAKPVLACSVPFTFSRSTIGPVGVPCRLGEHNAEVLLDWLGIADDEIDALERNGALV